MHRSFCASPQQQALYVPRTVSVVGGNSGSKSHLKRQSIGTSHLDCPLFKQCSGCTLEASLEAPPLAEQAVGHIAERHPQADVVLEPNHRVHGKECDPCSCAP